MVYHYCSTEVFNRIITGKSLMLSDISKSNDSMEILWITKHIKPIFDEEFDKENKSVLYFNNYYPKDIFEEMLEHYIEYNIKDDNRLYSYFVCCFSEKNDLLSQWRGYADDAKGFSIGFNEEVLKQLGNYEKPNQNYGSLSFNKVEYSEYLQKSIVKKEAQKLISNLKGVAKDKQNNDSINIKERSMKAFNDCFYRLFRNAIFMKNPFFKEEQEWRICLCDDMNSNFSPKDEYISYNMHLSEIGFHFRSDNIIPHVLLDFSDCNTDFIQHVVIGPKCATRKEEVEVFLKKNGINCQVEKSHGTYR